MLLKVDDKIPEEFSLIQKLLSVFRYYNISQGGFLYDKAMAGLELATFSENNTKSAFRLPLNESEVVSYLYACMQ